MKYLYLIFVLSGSPSWVHSSMPTFKYKRPCTNIQDLPNDMIGQVIQYLDRGDVASLQQASKSMGPPCHDESLRKLYISETHTFMPAVKRCIIQDHVDCYKYVLQYFQSQGLVEKHHVAQIPPLAARHGAKELFAHLNLTSEHPRWIQWMTRAASRGQMLFLRRFTSPSSLTSNAQSYITKFNPSNIWTSYSNNHPVFTETWPLEFDIVTMSPPIDMADGTFDLDMIYKQLDRCPSIHAIDHALKIKPLKKRRRVLTALQSAIKAVLSDGIYTIDDVLMSPYNTFLLWRNYTQHSTDTRKHFNIQGSHRYGGGASDFVRFLMSEGAPLDEMALINEMLLTSHEDTDFAREWITYGSGSPTVSLVRMISHQYRNRIWHIVTKTLLFYKDLGADMLDPVLLITVMNLLKGIGTLTQLPPNLTDREKLKEIRINKTKSKRYNRILELFIENGLRKWDLELISRYATQHTSDATELLRIYHDWHGKWTYFKKYRTHKFVRTVDFDLTV